MDRPALDTAVPTTERRPAHATLSRVAQFLGWTFAVHTALLLSPLTLLAWYVPMPLLLSAYLVPSLIVAWHLMRRPSRHASSQPVPPSP